MTHSKSPRIKLRILPADYPAEEVFELDQARDRLNFEHGTFLVQGEPVHSYEELVKLASQTKYRNQDFIEVVGILPIAGG
jgi:hypothetical protein